MDLSLPLVAPAAAKPAADAATDAAAVEAAADAATDAEPTSTLRDCLSAYFAPEELRGDERYCCERCQRACARASSDETAPAPPAPARLVAPKAANRSYAPRSAAWAAWRLAAASAARPSLLPRLRISRFQPPGATVRKPSASSTCRLCWCSTWLKMASTLFEDSAHLPPWTV